MTLRRLAVETLDHGTWFGLGSVLVPWEASDEQLEHALAAVGVYAPRGADFVIWSQFVAVIFDARKEPMVRLVSMSSAERKAR